MQNRKALVLLFFANAISGFAQGVSLLSIPWYFTQQQEDGLFKVAYGTITLIIIFWGLLAGTIVDRYSRKNVFLITNLIEGVIMLAIALWGFYVGLHWLHIVFVFGLTFMGFYLHYPNLYAFVQEITPPNQYSKITSYIEIVGQSSNLVAGSLAAVLLTGLEYDKVITIGVFSLPVHISISSWSLSEIFLMDAITYGLSFLLIIFIKYTPYQSVKVEKGALIKRLASGFRYLTSNRLILIFGFFSYAIFIVLLVQLHAVMPGYIKHYLAKDGSVLGVVQTFYAAGALVAGFFIQRLAFKDWTVKSIIGLMLLATGALFLVTLTRSAYILILMGFLLGLANAGVRVLRLSFLFTHIPNNIIGRVNSIFSLVSTLLRALLIYIFSMLFFAGENIVYAYIILGIFTLIAGVVLIFHYKQFKQLPNTHPEA